MALSLTCRRLLYRQHPTFLQCRQSGFIVMLPDVPQHDEENPLLCSEEYPAFSSLTLRKCYDGIVRRSLDFEAGFWRLEAHIKEKKKMTDLELFQDYLCPIEELSRPLENAYNIVKIIRQTSEEMTLNKYSKIASRAALAVENKFTSPLLYHSCKMALANDNASMKDDQKRLLKKYITLGKLNGMELSHKKYDILLAHRKTLLKSQTSYNNKLEYDTRLYRYPIGDAHMVKNFPKPLLSAMSDGPDPTRGPWTLRYGQMEAFLEYCPDAVVRDKVWHSKVTIGLENELAKLNPELHNIRVNRKIEAKYLGFNTFADYAMTFKMAGSVDNALSMLDHLHQKARPAQAHEIESLNKFAFQSGYHKPLEFWDVAFWKREQLAKTYDFDDKQISPYFPLDTVLFGLFSLLRDLYGVEIKEKTGVDTWHKDVRVYEVFEENGSSPSAVIYLDPYSRKGKPYSFGNSLTLRNHSLVGKEQIPHVGLVFNFSPAGEGRPCLLSYRDVIDLFGRVGYASQVLMSKAAYAEIAGTSFIEVDAVEIPSHFMVHWAFTPAVVASISGHYETGEKLPESFLNNLERVRKHMAGFGLCNEIYKCRLDLELAATDVEWKSVMDELWPQYFAFTQDPYDHSPLSFYEIYNDRGAAYYSDLWSRVIAADIFTAFEEAGLENKRSIRNIGERFRHTYLAGLDGAADNFRKFRGRDPSPDAFLMWLGLQKPLKSVQPN